ncbi:MAG: pre-16S rRNA-processing nuclease YqgF [Negativicutes bacterium]|nr:pre-16S rRNA-processing nuclease YqgF [Negativicutes bacterium]
MIDTVIAIDPGREKCGVAVVGKRDGLLWKQVIATPRLATVVEELARTREICTVVIGDRTAHQSAVKALAEVRINDRPLSVHPVDEHRSSDEARGRYWLDNPPRGVMRLVPVTMRTPPVPVDDYVAVILAERYFRQNCR